MRRVIDSPASYRLELWPALTFFQIQPETDVGLLRCMKSFGNNR